MRVLLFGPYPRTDEHITGGVMAVVRALAREMAHRPDIEVAVASASSFGPETTERAHGITHHRLIIPPRPRTRWHGQIRRKLVAVAQTFQPDIIHAHGTAYYANAALDSGLPAVITAHGVVYQEAKRSSARDLKAWLAWQYDAYVEKKLMQRARRLIAISPYIRQAFAHYPHLQWTDIPNPVDSRFFDINQQPAPARLFVPARVIPRKGVDILLQAFALIAADFPQASLYIAGETSSFSDFVRRCQHIVQTHGLSQRVHFLGPLKPPDLMTEYARASMVILPARQETAPVVIEEALAAGCPVIATRVGGIPWMVAHERTGLLVPPEDPSALAAALARALSDERALKTWRQNAKQAAQQYHVQSVVNKTLDLYEEILHG